MTEPSAHFTVLVVCTANVCRSPLAERLLQRRLDGASPGPPSFVVRSAGIRALVGAPMDPAAAAELARLGGDPSGAQARDLTVAQCETADLILTATAAHRAYVLEECPRALKRTFTLLEFAHLVSHVESVRRMAGAPESAVCAASAARGESSLTDYDVGDPFGGSPAEHREVADLISEAVAQVVIGLAGVAAQRTTVD